MKKEKTTEEPLAVTLLAQLVLQPLTDERVALLLTDIAGRRSGYAIGPDELNKILGPLLALVKKWSHVEGRSLDTLLGPRMALPAQRVGVEQGRDATECALRVFVGKVEFSFLIPLSAIAELKNTMEAFFKKETRH